MAGKDINWANVEKVLEENNISLRKQFGGRMTQELAMNAIISVLTNLQNEANSYVAEKKNEQQLLDSYKGVVTIMEHYNISENSSCFKSLISNFIPEEVENFLKIQKEGKDVSLDEVEKILSKINLFDLPEVLRNDKGIQAEWKNNVKSALESLKNKYNQDKENFIGDYNSFVSEMAVAGISEGDACFKSLIETFMPDDFEKNLAEKREQEKNSKPEEQQNDENTEVNPEPEPEENQNEEEQTESAKPEETEPQPEESQEQETEQNDSKPKGKTVSEEYRSAIKMCRKINRLADKIEIDIDNGDRVNHVTSKLISVGMKGIGDVSVLVGTTIKVGGKVTLKLARGAIKYGGKVISLAGKKFKPKKKEKEEKPVDRKDVQETLDKVKKKVDAVGNATMKRANERKKEYFDCAFPGLQENEKRLVELHMKYCDGALEGQELDTYLKLCDECGKGLDEKYCNGQKGEFLSEIGDIHSLQTDLSYRAKVEGTIEKEIADEKKDVHKDEVILKYCYALDLDFSAYNLQTQIEEIQNQVNKISEKESSEKGKVTFSEKLRKRSLVNLALAKVKALETRKNSDEEKNKSPINSEIDRQRESVIKVIVDGTELLTSQKNIDKANIKGYNFLYSQDQNQDQDEQEQSDR